MSQTSGTGQQADLGAIRTGLATQGAPRRRLVSNLKDVTGKPRIIPNPYLRYEPVHLKANDSLIAGQPKMRQKTPHAQHHSTFRGASRSSQPGALGMNLPDEKDEMLDLVNKVQMFQIAVKKINHNLSFKGKQPVYELAEPA